MKMDDAKSTSAKSKNLEVQIEAGEWENLKRIERDRVALDKAMNEWMRKAQAAQAAYGREAEQAWQKLKKKYDLDLDRIVYVPDNDSPKIVAVQMRLI